MKPVYSFTLTFLLLFPITLCAMADKQQPLSREEAITQLFKQTVIAIMQKRTEQHFKAPRKLRVKTKRRISSYTPNSDQEWEIVVVD